eukprot:TRINITY_DN12163_c0_g1_i1.p1 TRINITY_DN12163_c0_g1~~TRINITY_DN12163_c0_g1_i1.p1  ORF type:complete len:195 (-),score=38.50 TRINITY_DN12163_c0_g1_i1:265-789(-)
MRCLRGLGVLCGSSFSLPCQDESSRQECTSSSSNSAVLHHLPENADTTAPARGCNNIVEEQLPVGSSGISFSSMASGRDAESQSSSEELPSKKEQKDHMSRIEEFIADMSKDPESLRRRVKHRLEVFLDTVHGRQVQNVPVVEVKLSPWADDTKYASPSGSDVSSGAHSFALSQ